MRPGPRPEQARHAQPRWRGGWAEITPLTVRPRLCYARLDENVGNDRLADSTAIPHSQLSAAGRKRNETLFRHTLRPVAVYTVRAMAAGSFHVLFTPLRARGVAPVSVLVAIVVMEDVGYAPASDAMGATMPGLGETPAASKRVLLRRSLGTVPSTSEIYDTELVDPAMPGPGPTSTEKKKVGLSCSRALRCCRTERPKLEAMGVPLTPPFGRNFESTQQ